MFYNWLRYRPNISTTYTHYNNIRNLHARMRSLRPATQSEASELGGCWSL